jgi:gluconate 5-dehydrogenase
VAELSLFDLSGKTAIVTGGYGHLGASISEGLAQANANVFITGRDENKCIDAISKINKENASLNLDYQVLDIGNSDSIKDAFKNIYAKTGRIDILVNNAYYGAMGSIEEMSEEDWQKGIDGSINSVFRCTKAILPYFTSGGNIINVASMYGVVSPNPSIYGNSGQNNPANYGTGKAAIIQFTKYSAVHLASKNIRVNCISPGPFPNPEVQKNIEFIDRLKEKVPMGRIGKPDDLKGVVIFLASGASSYVTGQNICVDGGWTIW